MNINNIEIPVQIFQAAATFCSNSAYRREMQYVQVKHSLGHLEIWATDGHRVFRHRQPCEPFTEFYVKGNDIKGLKLGRNPEPFKFSISDQIMESGKSVKLHYLSDLRSDAHGFRFPECALVWNETAQFWLWNLDIEQTVDIVKAMLPMAGDSEIFEFNWAENRIEVENSDEKYGVKMEGRAEIPGTHTTDAPNLRLNGKLFREVLNSIKKATGEVRLRMFMSENNGIRKGIVFETHKSRDSEITIRAMLMPVLPKEDMEKNVAARR